MVGLPCYYNVMQTFELLVAIIIKVCLAIASNIHIKLLLTEYKKQGQVYTFLISYIVAQISACVIVQLYKKVYQMLVELEHDGFRNRFYLFYLPISRKCNLT